MNETSMKALRYVGHASAALVEMPRPTAAEGEVLLRVGAAGICHSDVHVAHATTSLTQLDDLAPFTLGHEIAGEVVEVGAGVDQALLGMRAAVYAPTGCLTCASCRAGAWNYCDTRQPTSIAGLGLGQDGGLAPYLAVDPRRLVDIGDLPFEVAAVLTDAALTSVHAISMIPPATGTDSTVVVIGVGGLGHLAVQVLAHRGYRVVGVDNKPSAEQIAIESGAHAYCTADTLIETVAEQAGPRGAVGVLDFVGSSQTLALAESALGTHGSLVLVGSAGGSLVVDKSRRGIPRGVSYHVPVWGMLPEMDVVMDLARQGVLRPVITRTTLDEAEAGLDALHDGTVAGRLVVTDFGDDEGDEGNV